MDVCPQSTVIVGQVRKLWGRGLCVRAPRNSTVLYACETTCTQHLHAFSTCLYASLAYSHQRSMQPSPELHRRLPGQMSTEPAQPKESSVALQAHGAFLVIATSVHA
eukprot:1144463-Pelagomonas_calceolata.AAC.5